MGIPPFLDGFVRLRGSKIEARKGHLSISRPLKLADPSHWQAAGDCQSGELSVTRPLGRSAAAFGPR
jgi:hypothetical protein